MKKIYRRFKHKQSEPVKEYSRFDDSFGVQKSNLENGDLEESLITEQWDASFSGQVCRELLCCLTAQIKFQLEIWFHIGLTSYLFPILLEYAI